MARRVGARFERDGVRGQEAAGRVEGVRLGEGAVVLVALAMGDGQRGGARGADAVAEQADGDVRERPGVQEAGLGLGLQAVGEGAAPAGEEGVGQLQADDEGGGGRLRAG